MRRLLSILTVAVTTTAAGLAAGAPAAVASTPSQLTIVGHGWGHGRGMGQYGAYGYALQGWGYQQILGQYYGGAYLAGTDSSLASTPVDVELSELYWGTVGAAGTNLVASWAGGSVSGSSVTVTRAGSGLAVNGTAVSGDVTITVGSGDVQLALPSGWRSYKGSVVVKAGTGQTWNVLPLDSYVAGVVPAESPASWGVNGFASLQAQAVAARSYALARIRDAGPAICDTTACQVYDGDPDAAGNPTNSSYTTYTDRAVSSTSGQVLRCSAAACGQSGSVALAEFSSSTGGWTAGGAFNAAVDAGDSTASNPNHNWTATVDVSLIQSIWPSIGTFQGLTVTARNGLGDLGGRVTSLVLSGTSGQVTMSGAQFAGAVGLKSDWFAVTNTDQPSGGMDGYWIVSAAGGVYTFGNAPWYGSTAGMALNAPVDGMAPTSDQLGYWVVARDGGIFSFGDAHFYGSTGGLRLNAPVLGMTPTHDGGGYWLFAGDGGVFSFGDARFHGSTGGMRLNQPVVGMAATPDGGGYWLVAADGGVFAFGDAGFYGSEGGVRLNQPVVGMVPTADGKGYTLVARDGGIFTFGDARFMGSLPGLGVADTAVSVAPTPDGGGYLVLGGSGRVYAFGDAPYMGDATTVSGGMPTPLAIFGHRG